MKVRNSKGELKELVIKVNDSIPAGSVIDFEGDVVPEGYEKVEENEKGPINYIDKINILNPDLELNNNFNHLILEGNRVCINISLTVKTDTTITTNTGIIKLPNEVLPKASISLVGDTGNWKEIHQALSYIRKSDGNIVLNAYRTIKSTEEIHITGSYYLN